MEIHHAKKNGPGALLESTEAAQSQPKDLSDRIALERAADKAHMEYLVASVASQLLAVSLPGVGATAADMQEWATTRARNVLCGLMGERL